METYLNSHYAAKWTADKYLHTQLMPDQALFTNACKDAFTYQIMLDQDFYFLNTRTQGVVYLPQCNIHTTSQGYGVA